MAWPQNHKNKLALSLKPPNIINTWSDSVSDPGCFIPQILLIPQLFWLCSEENDCSSFLGPKHQLLPREHVHLHHTELCVTHTAGAGFANLAHPIWATACVSGFM